MKTNLETIKANLFELKDRFSLDGEESELIDKVNRAKKASEVPLRVKDVNIIRAIKRRLISTDEDKRRLKEIGGRIMRLPVSREAKKIKKILV